MQLWQPTLLAGMASVVRHHAALARRAWPVLIMVSAGVFALGLPPLHDRLSVMPFLAAAAVPGSGDAWLGLDSLGLLAALVCSARRSSAFVPGFVHAFAYALAHALAHAFAHAFA